MGGAANPLRQCRRECRQWGHFSKSRFEMTFDANSARPQNACHCNFWGVFRGGKFCGDLVGMAIIVQKVGTAAETHGWRYKIHGIAVGHDECAIAVVDIGMEWGGFQAINERPIHDVQIDDGGIAEVEIASRQLRFIRGTQGVLRARLLGIQSGRAEGTAKIRVSMRGPNSVLPD